MLRSETFQTTLVQQIWVLSVKSRKFVLDTKTTCHYCKCNRFQYFLDDGIAKSAVARVAFNDIPPTPSDVGLVAQRSRRRWRADGGGHLHTSHVSLGRPAPAPETTPLIAPALQLTHLADPRPIRRFRVHSKPRIIFPNSPAPFVFACREVR